MSIWKQHITNAVRTGRSNQLCVADRTLAGRIRCNSNANSFDYGYDAHMTPRCDGGPEKAIGRSVFYTLRKTLRCPSTVVKAETKKEDTRKVQLSEKKLRAIQRHRKIQMTQNKLKYQLLPKRGAGPMKKVVEQVENEMDNGLNGLSVP